MILVVSEETSDKVYLILLSIHCVDTAIFVSIISC